MSVVLGIDGGGTKTTCAVARDGQLMASATTGGSNLVRLREAEVRNSIHSAIRQACAAAGVSPDEIDSACVGLAGAGRELVRDVARRILNEVVSCPVEVTTDIAIAHTAAFRDDAGVIVISGTGSIAYGVNEAGEIARAGGWGPVVSDEGSGEWIGRTAIARCLRAIDHGDSPELLNRLLGTLRLADVAELIIWSNAPARASFGQCFPVVALAAAEGDELAIEILRDAGCELAEVSARVIRRLWLPAHPAEVAVAGGVLRSSRLVRDTFTETVQNMHPEARVRELEQEPVMGAIHRAEQVLERKKLARGSEQR